MRKRALHAAAVVFGAVEVRQPLRLVAGTDITVGGPQSRAGIFRPISNDRNML